MKEDNLSTSFEEIINNLGKKASVGIKSFIRGWRESQKPIPARDPSLVEKSPRVKIKQDTLVGFGIGGGITGSILTLTFLFEVLTGRFADLPYLVVFGLLTLGSFGLFARSRYYKKAGIRLEKYIRALGSGTVSKIDEMAKVAGVPIEMAKKDLESFIQDNTFKEAQIVEDGQLFILDYPTYLLYKKQAKSLEKVEQEKLQEKTDLDQNEGKVAFSRIKNDYTQLRQEGKDKVLPLITTIERIYKHVDEYPENKKALGKFNSYYLPTLQELVGRYLLLQDNSQLNQSAQALRELENSFSQINLAFEELLDNLGGSLARDSLSEVSVLKTLMKQDGLIDRDFEMEEDHGRKRN